MIYWGYTNLIDRVKNKPKEAIKLIKYLKGLLKESVEKNLNSKLFPGDEPLKNEPMFKIFSDCICISSDFMEKESEFSVGNVFSFLIDLMYIQAELALSGIIIRGGITIDYHYQDEDIIFSSALVDSYKMERDQAIYPRILINSSVIEFFKENDSEANFPLLNELIKRDADGYAFLDYLEYM